MVLKNYNDYNDLELLDMVRESSDEAKDVLFEKYKYIIDVEVRKYINMAHRLGYEYVDLYQDGLVGFANALNSYRDDKDTQLSTFITLCVDRSLQGGILKAGRSKNKLISDSLSLEYFYDNYSAPLKDIISDNQENDPLENMVKEENFKELVTAIEEGLSSSEFEVYSLMLNGLKYDEIALLTGKNLKQTDNTIQRIKIKTRKILLDKKGE